MMRATPLGLPGALLIEPEVHTDPRGFFQETYRRSELQALGVFDDFVQDNHSRSTRGVLRGLHFQVGQAKLVHCSRGAIFDVVVDVRRKSPSFGRWAAAELSDVNHSQIYVPIGFAHGFCVLSEVADVIYKVSAYYDPGLERTLAYDDPALGIDWPDLELTVSERDAHAPRLAEIADELPFEYSA